MFELKYIKKYDDGTKNKPKVYFSCHPDDLKYLDGISNEIFKYQKCVIYYNDYNQMIDCEELEFQLSQMKLFIIPITKNFLLDENISLNFEFNYAIKNNIAILPLMYDSSLVNIFNEKCGSIQYLDFHQQEFSFKFKRFLKSVLISDELIEEIKNTFDKHVFLSYRKKDKRYAQQIMKTIHANTFLRDVAIWYDEFLTVGENFNDEIEKTIEESDMVILNVTPNILEEPNYVKDVEYKLAKAYKKPIVAIETVKTDTKLLKKKYINIGSCVDLFNYVDEIEKVLKRELFSKDVDPYHDYYVALAYLYGIEVEVDQKKGVEMLKELSDMYYIEAKEKLADMYKYGDCVEIDLSKEEELREEIIECYESLIEDGEDCYYPYLAESYNNMASINLDKYELYTANLNIDKALKIIKDYEMYYPEDKIKYCNCLKNKINYLIICQDFKQAKKYVLKSIDILQGLKEIDFDVENDLADLFYSLGVINQNIQDNIEAKENLEKYLKIKLQQTQSENLLYFDDLYKAYKALAEYHCENHNYEETMKYFNNALEICKNFSDESYQKYLTADIYFIVGKNYLNQFDLKNAEEYLLKAIKNVEELIDQKYNVIKCKRKLSQYLYILALINFYKKDYVSAEKLLIKNIDEVYVFLMRFEFLVSSYDYLTPLYSNLILIIDLYINSNNLEKIPHYLEIVDKLVAKFTSACYLDYVKEVAILERKQQIALLENNINDSVLYFNKRYELLKGLDQKEIKNLGFEIIKCIPYLIEYNYPKEELNYVFYELTKCIKTSIKLVEKEHTQATNYINILLDVISKNNILLDNEMKKLYLKLKDTVLKKYKLGKIHFSDVLNNLYNVLLIYFESDSKEKDILNKELISFLKK